MSTNYIAQVTDTAGTTQDIMESVDTRIFRATCNTAAATAQKVATLDDATNFSLTTGVRVAVTFQYGNSAATPTLQVGSTSAKTIAYVTSATARATGSGTGYNTWGPYETVIFTYDGTYWINGGSCRTIYNAYNSHYTTHLYAGASNGNTNAATTNGNTYLIACDNTTARDRRKIAGSGGCKVSSNASGEIDINAAPAYQYSTTDLTPGTSALTTGTLYFVYE